VRQLPLALELFKWMEQKEMARPLYTFNALIVACGRVCSKLCHSILVSMLSMFISLQLPRFRFRVVSMPSTFITTPQTALCNGFFCVLGIDVNCFAFVTSCKFNGCDGVFFPSEWCEQ
jgi:hypothetical protein